MLISRNFCQKIDFKECEKLEILVSNQLRVEFFSMKVNFTEFMTKKWQQNFDISTLCTLLYDETTLEA